MEKLLTAANLSGEIQENQQWPLCIFFLLTAAKLTGG